MSGPWNDFNSAQSNTNVIPKGTLAKVRLSSMLAVAKAEGEATELKGNAERLRLVAEAEGRRAQIEAENHQSDAVLRARMEMHRLDRMPEIAAQMMKPVEKIDSMGLVIERLVIRFLYGRLVDTMLATWGLFKFINSTAGPNYAIGAARLGGFNGIPGFQTLNVPFHPTWYIYDRSFYYLCCLVLIVTYALLRWLLASPFGRVAVAIRENEQRVELMGYDVRFRKTVLFSIGGAIAGLAGALFASWAEIVTPGLFSLAQSAEIIIWCIVGGLGTLVGPVIGAIMLSLLKFLLGQQTVIDSTLALGAILVLSVLFLPRGLIPSIGLLWTKGGSTARRRPHAGTARRRMRGASNV